MVRRRDKRAVERMERFLRRRELLYALFRVFMWTYLIASISAGIYGIIIGRWYIFLAVLLPVAYAISLSGGLGIKDILWVIFLGSGDSGD